MLTIREAAAALGMKPADVERLVFEGKLDAKWKLSPVPHWRIPKEAVETMVKTTKKRSADRKRGRK